MIFRKEKEWVKAVFVYPVGITEADERSLGWEVTVLPTGKGVRISVGALLKGC
jgi:hypothetical protein